MPRYCLSPSCIPACHEDTDLNPLACAAALDEQGVAFTACCGAGISMAKGWQSSSHKLQGVAVNLWGGWSFHTGVWDWAALSKKPGRHIQFSKATCAHQCHNPSSLSSVLCDWNSPKTAELKRQLTCVRDCTLTWTMHHAFWKLAQRNKLL